MSWVLRASGGFVFAVPTATLGWRALVGEVVAAAWVFVAMWVAEDSK